METEGSDDCSQYFFVTPKVSNSCLNTFKCNQHHYQTRKTFKLHQNTMYIKSLGCACIRHVVRFKLRKNLPLVLCRASSLALLHLSDHVAMIKTSSAALGWVLHPTSLNFPFQLRQGTNFGRLKLWGKKTDISREMCHKYGVSTSLAYQHRQPSKTRSRLMWLGCNTYPTAAGSCFIIATSSEK